jgi:hypothetical protein
MTVIDTVDRLVERLRRPHKAFVRSHGTVAFVVILVMISVERGWNHGGRSVDKCAARRIIAVGLIIPRASRRQRFVLADATGRLRRTIRVKMLLRRMSIDRTILVLAQTAVGSFAIGSFPASSSPRSRKSSTTGASHHQYSPRHLPPRVRRQLTLTHRSRAIGRRSFSLRQIMASSRLWLS